MSHTTARITTAVYVQLNRLAAHRPVHRRDRGDVPGWVLITVMTAGIVSALWLVAGPALQNLFTSAVNSVSKK